MHASVPDVYVQHMHKSQSMHISLQVTRKEKNLKIFIDTNKWSQKLFKKILDGQTQKKLSLKLG